MKKFLLHVCCAPCAIYVLQALKNRGFDVTVFFYNPNIYPPAEYKIRLNEIKKYCQENQLKFIAGEDDHSVWLAKVKDFKNEPEGGQRCTVCFKERLEKTATYATANNYEYFGSTLSISPHKNVEVINQIGSALGEKYQLNFYPEDWKKKDGFKQGCQLSHQHKFYRQNYCGCEYSQKH